MMFKAISLDAKIEDIKKCFNDLKNLFPSGCSISISEEVKTEEEKRDFLNEEKLRKAVQETLADGKIEEQEKKELEIKRQVLGVSKELASWIYFEEIFRISVRNVISRGKINERDKEDLHKLRQKIKIPEQEASQIFSEEVLRKRIQAVLSAGSLSHEQKRALQKLGSDLNVPLETASRIFSEEKARISSLIQKKKELQSKEKKTVKAGEEKPKKVEDKDKEEKEQLKVKAPVKKHSPKEEKKTATIKTDITLKKEKPEKKNYKSSVQINLADSAIEILKEGKKKGLKSLYIQPDIPKKIKSIAFERHIIRQEKNILGILPLTESKKNKHLLIFDEKGIYFRNPPFSKDMGKKSILYRDYKGYDLKLDGKFEITLGTGHFLNVSGFTSDEKHIIIEILNSLRDFY